MNARVIFETNGCTQGKKEGSRHCEVADYPVLADSVDARAGPQQTADIDDLRYPSHGPPTVLEMSMRLSMTELLETVGRDIFLCHPERDSLSL